MLRKFPNDVVTNYYKAILNLLYKADGRTSQPPEEPFYFHGYDRIITHQKLDEDLNESSNIIVTPYKSVLDVRNFRTDYMDREVVNVNFQNDFVEFPFEIEKPWNKVEIDNYFFYYSEMGINEPTHQALAEHYIVNNLSIHRSDFLYMMMVRKFETMDERYQEGLKTYTNFNINWC